MRWLLLASLLSAPALATRSQCAFHFQYADGSGIPDVTSLSISKVRRFLRSVVGVPLAVLRAVPENELLRQAFLALTRQEQVLMLELHELEGKGRHTQAVIAKRAGINPSNLRIHVSSAQSDLKTAGTWLPMQEGTDDPRLRRSVLEMGLAVNVAKALIRAGAPTAGHLALLDPDALRLLRHMGPHRAQAAMEALTRLQRGADIGPH